MKALKNTKTRLVSNEASQLLTEETVKYTILVVTGPLGEPITLDGSCRVKNPLFVAEVVDLKSLDSQSRRDRLATDVVLAEFNKLITAISE